MINYIIVIAVLILLSAFFSGSEMSLSSANRMRLDGMAQNGSKRARMAVTVMDNFDDALSAILIGNNLVNIISSALASVFTITYFGETWTWLSTLCMTLIVILFGETIPKIVAKKNANRLAVSVAYIIRVLMFIFKPFIVILVGSVNLVTLPLKGDNKGQYDHAAVEELQSIIDTAEDEDVLDEERSELLKNAIDFSETSASEAMTARVDVAALDIDDDFESVMELVDEAGYSRLPVYRDSIDNIIGVLSLNHLLKAMVDEREPNIEALLMEPHYVYKTIKLPQVLSELRREKKHLAVVTDEYGGTLGVITLEDVLEEIVGDIWDETDDVEPEVVERSEGEYELDGDMSVSDFTELLDISEATFDFDSETVGGWTLEVFGGFPEEGQSFMYDNLQVTVLAMDDRRVDRVLIKRTEQ